MTTAPPGSPLFTELMDHSVRADPYPVYARMREQPVIEGPPGLFVVSRYADVHALLRDRRISSDMRRSVHGGSVRSDAAQAEGIGDPPFIFLDPPDHTRIRRLVVKEFRPRVVERLRSRIVAVVEELIDAAAERGSLELVADFAYPLPITVICELLGVPREHEPRFQRWSAALAHSLDPGLTMSPEERDEVTHGVIEMHRYMTELVAARRADPGEDYLSALVGVEEEGETLSEHELMTTLVLLLVAGHETTVNLIANAMLALLRHPEELARLQADPTLAGGVVEETLRYDPPVQLRNRTCLEDVVVDGVAIPARANLAVLLAAASRDPARFPHPDRFDPARDTGGHLGFGGGPHFCVGAGLARLEAQIVLAALARRLERPGLAEDPPPYRRNAALRGPERLEIEVAGIARAAR
jgi:cytochrome P450